MRSFGAAFGRARRGPSAGDRPHRRGRHHRPLRVERLEERHLLATYTVTSVADAPVTMVANPTEMILRQAIYNANQNAGPDTIQFSLGAGPHTIVLTEGELAILNEGASATEPEGLTIIGLGSGDLTIDAQGESRIFRTDLLTTATSPDELGDVAISGLTLKNGYAEFFLNNGTGAAIDSNDNLSVNDVTFVANSAEAGGAIHSWRGNLTVENSRFDTNKGSAIFARADFAVGVTITVDSSEFCDNTSLIEEDAQGAGGAINTLLSPATVIVTNSTFYRNQASTTGGAISTEATDVTISGSHFEENSVVDPDVAGAGGAVHIYSGAGTATIGGGSVFVSNRVESAQFNEQYGGAVYVTSDTVLIDGIEAYGNEAQFGGGIWIAAATTASISNSLIGSENSLLGNVSRSHGGGIYLFQLVDVTINNSRILNNFAVDDGGGIYADNVQGNPSPTAPLGVGHLAVQDSVISGNESGDSGGGIAFRSFTTGVVSGDPVDGVALSIARSTISENKAAKSGGGVYASFIWGQPTPPFEFTTVAVRDSTISGNTAYGGTGYSEGLGEGGGGGIFLRSNNYRYANTITNSTISGNRALNGGGVYVQADGNNQARVLFRHATIAENVAGPFRGDYDDADAPEESRKEQPTAGGGILFAATAKNDTVGETLSFDHTIVAKNIHFQDEILEPEDTEFNHELLDYSPDIGTFPYRWQANIPDEDLPWYVFEGYYTIFGELTGEVIFAFQPGATVWDLTPMQVAALLGPLQPNGGPTMTHMPLSGSFAIDRGNPAYDAGDPVALTDPTETLTYDQRGGETVDYFRVYDFEDDDTAPFIDIGAVERQPGDTDECHIPGDYNDDGSVDAADYVLWRKLLGQTVQLANEDPSVSPGKVTVGDYLVWRRNFGRTCETEMGSGAIVVMAGETGGDETAGGDERPAMPVAAAASGSQTWKNDTPFTISETSHAVFGRLANPLAKPAPTLRENVPTGNLALLTVRQRGLDRALEKWSERFDANEEKDDGDAMLPGDRDEFALAGDAYFAGI